MPAKTQEEYCEALDEQGEKRVRELKASGAFSDKHLAWVNLWLENKKRTDGPQRKNAKKIGKKNHLKFHAKLIISLNGHYLLH